MNFDKILTKVFGSSNERFLKTIRPVVEEISALEPEIQKLSDEQLREKTALSKRKSLTPSKTRATKTIANPPNRRCCIKSCLRRLRLCVKRANARPACGISMCR